jgi:hypothetical protein
MHVDLFEDLRRRPLDKCSHRDGRCGRGDTFDRRCVLVADTRRDVREHADAEFLLARAPRKHDQQPHAADERVSSRNRIVGYTTGVNDHEALRALPNVIRLRNERVDRNSGRRLVEHDPDEARVIEAVRIGRRENAPITVPDDVEQQ